jgi:hypothetical protein
MFYKKPLLLLSLLFTVLVFTGPGVLAQWPPCDPNDPSTCGALGDPGNPPDASLDVPGSGVLSLFYNVASVQTNLGVTLKIAPLVTWKCTGSACGCPGGTGGTVQLTMSGRAFGEVDGVAASRSYWIPSLTFPGVTATSVSNKCVYTRQAIVQTAEEYGAVTRDDTTNATVGLTPTIPGCTSNAVCRLRQGVENLNLNKLVDVLGADLEVLHFEIEFVGGIPEQRQFVTTTCSGHFPNGAPDCVDGSTAHTGDQNATGSAACLLDFKPGQLPSVQTIVHAGQNTSPVCWLGDGGACSGINTFTVNGATAVSRFRNSDVNGDGIRDRCANFPEEVVSGGCVVGSRVDLVANANVGSGARTAFDSALCVP